jgi:predicted glycosyltransferase involved in capsule biosynthesis
MITQSIIISYKENNEDRKNNLKKLLSYLSNLLDEETEIVLVEQDSVRRIDWLNSIKNHERINHVFLKNNGMFNKGWGYNFGVKNSTGNYLSFNDADMFLKLDEYRSSFKLLNEFDIINPYNSLCYLDKENSDKFAENEFNFDAIDMDSSMRSYVTSGGIFMIRKNAFLMIKGFDEKCYGYGYEDCIFDVKIEKLELLVNHIPNTAIHIYHEVIKDDYYSRIELNKDLFMKYRSMTPTELKSKIYNLNFFGNQIIS